MAQLPSATTSLDPTAGPTGAPTSYLAIFGACKTLADGTPRLFSSVSALLETHDYCEGAEAAALFVQQTGLPFIFVPLPIVTAGTIGRRDATGWAGTSVPSVAAAAGGVLAEVDCMVRVFTGGTRGTNGIILEVSIDGDGEGNYRTFKKVPLKTNTSYTIPYVGIVVSFGAGTMVAGDEYTFSTTAPLWDQAGLALGRAGLAAQSKLTRSWLIVGDLATDDAADDVLTEVNAYETSHDRFTGARCQVSDRLPRAALSHDVVRMTGSNTITFVDGGGSADTVTRSSGDWVADGFAAGDMVTFAGTLSNNTTIKLVSLTASTLTFATATVVAEVAVTPSSVTGTPSLVFAEAGASDTITRSRGSWTDDGFRVGDLITISGTASNNITATVGIATLTATVLTLGDVADDLAAETIGSASVTITAGQTMAAWVAAQDAEFADIDAEERINLALGRARKTSPITNYKMRRPAQWAVCIRAFEHPEHIPAMRKEDGPLSGWDLEDADGNTVEYDERVHGGGLAGRFTCLRTWGNGPNGAFVALDLTRAEDDTLLSRQHNMDVANLAMTVVQRATENAVGKVLRLKDGALAGTKVGTESSLSNIEESVNTDLAIALLQDSGEGPRADSARWTASRSDILNVAGATITGVLALGLNGTIEHVETTVRVS